MSLRTCSLAWRPRKLNTYVHLTAEPIEHRTRARQRCVGGRQWRVEVGVGGRKEGMSTIRTEPWKGQQGPIEAEWGSRSSSWEALAERSQENTTFSFGVMVLQFSSRRLSHPHSCARMCIGLTLNTQIASYLRCLSFTQVGAKKGNLSLSWDLGFHDHLDVCISKAHLAPPPTPVPKLTTETN